ncbi:hypothetical protein DFO73_11641 [Cytobacillus oceanisediminis]|uniref:Uncharacterized protein n=1 Tax=Cytobacillus oceanisediminis TaxID=665099 RepID=A0A2V2ZLI0_9BACI|nr:hypothetical protein [Cytobacillus oceanisediminis]PWW20227.1 hypothetical protein DFO73_11641 [Cytobacillus oceanisediminis]
MAKIKTVINNLLGKIETTSERYEQTLEKKQEELIETQQKLQDAQFKLKDFHKMKVLGDITEEAYEAEAVTVKALTEKIETLHKEIGLIDTYKTEDVDAVLAEIKKAQAENVGEASNEVSQIKYKMQQAKLEYLQKIAEAREEYWKAVSTENRLNNILVKLGKKNQNYLSGAYEAIGFAGYGNGYSTTNLMVQQNEVFDALNYGRLPSPTISAVEKGKKAGYIK